MKPLFTFILIIAILNSSCAQSNYNRYIFGNEFLQEGIRLSQVKDDGFLLFSDQQFAIDSPFHVVIQRVSSKADLIWEKDIYFHGITGITLHDLLLNNNKYYLLCSSLDSNYYYKIILLELDSNANILSQVIIMDSNASNIGTRLLKLSSGFLIGGFKLYCSELNVNCYSRAALYKINNQMQLVFDSVYSFSAYNDNFQDIIIKNNTTFYGVVNASQLADNGYGLVVKFDSSGKISLSKKFDQAADEFLFGFIKTSDDGFFIHARSILGDYGIIYKTDSLLNIQWMKIPGFFDLPDQALQIEDSVLAICNNKIEGDISSGSNLHNLEILKLKLDGTEISNVKLSNNLSEYSNDFQETDSGNFVILGLNSNQTKQTTEKILLIITTDGSVITGTTPTAQNDSSFELFPNPASQFIYFNVNCSKLNTGRFQVFIVNSFDQVLKNENFNSCSLLSRVDLSDLPPDFYLLEIADELGKRIFAKPFIIIR